MSGLPMKTEQFPGTPRAAGSFRKLLLPPELFCTCVGLLSPRGSVHLGEDTAASTQRGCRDIQTHCVHRLLLTCHRPPAPDVRGGVPGPGLPSREEGRCCKTKGTVTKIRSHSAQNLHLYFPSKTRPNLEQPHLRGQAGRWWTL